MIFRSFTLVILLCFFISCAPAPMMVKEHPLEINFEKTPDYQIQDKLNSISKPDKLKPIYVRLVSENNIEIVSSAAEATHILLAPKEYAKIAALLKLAKTYKSVAIEQETLVNTYIAQINGYKELLELERQKSALYQELYVDSENGRRLEQHQHKIDNVVNKAQNYVLLIGTIALVLFAL